MNRESYEGEIFDGSAAVAWEPAVLPISNRATQEPVPTETADKVLLADGREILVCTVGDCRFIGTTIQAIILSHRPREHRDQLKDWSNRPKGGKQRFDLGDLTSVPFGKVIEMALETHKNGGRDDALVDKWRTRALNAEAELRAVEAALRVLGIKENK